MELRKKEDIHPPSRLEDDKPMIAALQQTWVSSAKPRKPIPSKPFNPLLRAAAFPTMQLHEVYDEQQEEDEPDAREKIPKKDKLTITLRFNSSSRLNGNETSDVTPHQVDLIKRATPPRQTTGRFVDSDRAAIEDTQVELNAQRERELASMDLSSPDAAELNKASVKLIFKRPVTSELLSSNPSTVSPPGLSQYILIDLDSKHGIAQLMKSTNDGTKLRIIDEPVHHRTPEEMSRPTSNSTESVERQLLQACILRRVDMQEATDEQELAATGRPRPFHPSPHFRPSATKFTHLNTFIQLVIIIKIYAETKDDYFNPYHAVQCLLDVDRVHIKLFMDSHLSDPKIDDEGTECYDVDLVPPTEGEVEDAARFLTARGIARLSLLAELQRFTVPGGSWNTNGSGGSLWPAWGAP